MLLYLGQSYSQSYLAGPYDPSRGLYGTETTSQEGTYIWKLARTLNALDGNSVPSWWVWTSWNANYSQTAIVDKLLYDLDHNLPQANRVKTNPGGGYKLKGFVGNYGHYITCHGYWYTSPSWDKILYTNSFEDPNNGSDTSLGRWWWPTVQVTYCNTVHQGGWIVW
jgi:hypothetical protein